MAHKSPINPSLVPIKGEKTFNQLQEENARLKDLVVTLSSLLLKNVVHEFRSDVHILSSGSRASKAEERVFAQALDDAGHELMAKAAEMKSVFHRQKWNKH